MTVKRVLTLSGVIVMSAMLGCSDEQEAVELDVTQESAVAKAVAESKPMADGYPIDYCVISNEKLGEMGEPTSITVEGRVVKLCCASCEAAVREDPAKYLAMLDQANPAK